MELELLRFSDKNKSTLGLLFADLGCCRDFLCFILEDPHREKKIKKKTRIPEGRRKIELRTYGRHHEDYKKRFPDFHRGMLEIKDVPNFTDILLHIGNFIWDTEGCPLPGNIAVSNIYSPATLGDSTSAYKYMYKYIIAAFDREEEVWINIIDYQRKKEK